MKPMLLTAALLALPALDCADGSPTVEAESPPARDAAPARGDEEEAFDHDHELFDELLEAHVRGDWLDYEGMAGDRGKLDHYLERLHAVTPDQHAEWTRAQQYAFWINVYNAHVIQLVLDNYPIRSIKDIGGAIFNKVWDKRFIPMPAFDPDGENRQLSLDDVEHQILRPKFKDARVHAAVNCASYSCPPILDAAFVAERLDAQLDAQMRRFVNDPLRNVFDEEKKVLRLSEIFNWFASDFERDAGSVRDYLKRYAPEDKASLIQAARIKHLDYDWTLNDIEENRI